MFSEFILHENFIEFPLRSFASCEKPKRPRLLLNNIKITHNPRLKEYEKKLLISPDKKQLTQHSKHFFSKNQRLSLIEKTRRLFPNAKTERYFANSEEAPKLLDSLAKKRGSLLTGRQKMISTEQRWTSFDFGGSKQKKQKNFLGSAIHRAVIKIPKKAQQISDSHEARVIKSRQKNRRNSSEGKRTDYTNFHKRPSTMQNRLKVALTNRKSSQMLEPW